ncbi:MAG: translation elongation factor 4 [candidate division WWE3 bacterium]|nr:translation elongation factor 4 [candidate division WWE3 bacterium]
MKQQQIRNFAIIAHVDHGKSTLADRLLNLTGTVSSRDMREQFLDSLDLERERGITIKLKSVRMTYQGYTLNLIDTPGHVDFSYEVSRSLAACEGAILVVDATQGIQAQTLAHVQKAQELGLTIIPVLNKIDLPTAYAEETKADLVSTFGFLDSDILAISAKTGAGVQELLTEIIKKIPAPTGLANEPLQALVFDSYYDEHQGVIAAIKVTAGQLSQTKMLAKHSGEAFDPIQIGVNSPKPTTVENLSTGEVGFVATGLKDLSAVRAGETLTTRDNPATQALPGYKEAKPVVFMSVYPNSGDDFLNLKKALEKLRLTDAALSFTPESSSALGFGYRVGFLGLLHSEIIGERLERDFGIALIYSLPSVAYEVTKTNGETEVINSPIDFPDPSILTEVREPWTMLSIIVPNQYLGPSLDLVKEHRGIIGEIKYFSASKVLVAAEMPLKELIIGFFDELKSVSSGFASLDYELGDYRAADVVKLNILVHNEVVPALSELIIRDQAEAEGRKILGRLKENLPRQQFAVSLQAAIGGHIIAREDLQTYRKDVLAKMSGGDQRRKDKLTDLQKRGKKKMRLIGKISIPADAYRKILAANS